jgi:hypothetical protein
MSNNILLTSKEKGGTPGTSTPTGKEQTRRIVVTESNYIALMGKGRFGQTFNDIITELLNPNISISSKYGPGKFLHGRRK